MEACRYRHSNGQSCNIDVTLFKEGIVNYASNYCYFHQSVYVFDKIYRRLDEFIEALAAFERTKNMDVSKAFSLLKLDHFSDLLKSCPSPDTYYEKFNKLMFEKDKVSFNCVNTSGFYFPVKHQAEVTLNFANVSQIWNNQLVLQNYKFYDVEFIDRLIRDIENNNSNDIRNIYNTLKYYEDEVLKYGFISHSNFREIKFNISNITFNEDIDIQGWADYLTWDYTFVKCNFNSPKIIIQSARSIDVKETIITSDNKVIDIDTASLSITNSSISSQQVILSVSYSSLLLDNILHKERLFTKAGDIHIYSSYGQPGTNQQKSFLKYVDLQKIVFYPYNQERTLANYQNLQLLEFVNCRFLPGHRLREDHSIDKYADYYEYSYRYLRKHFDDQIEGNDFHYNYMYWKSKALPNNWDRGADKILIALYSMANGNNTKPSHAIASITLVFVLAMIINTIGGTFEIKGIYSKEHMLFSINLIDFGYSCLYSFKNLIPLIQADMFIAKNWVTVLTSMIENVLGPLLTTLFVLAFRNRFRRSKTPEEIKEN